MMESPAAVWIVLSALSLGSIAGIGEKAFDGVSYENFLNSPDSYHLVDRAGNPVSQEVK